MILNFGRYRGESCEQVLLDDPSYVEWMLRQESLMPDFIEAQEYFRKLTGRKETEQRRREQERLPWWDVLEVRPTDSEEVIKRAYRKMMSLYHPDKVQQLGIELRKLAELKTQEINIAYDKAMKEREKR